MMEPISDSGDKNEHLVGVESPPRSVATYLSYRILRLHSALNAQAADILEGSCGLGLGQWRMLTMVVTGQARSSRELVKLTQMDPAFVSRKLKELEADGYLVAQRNDSDRRVLQLIATDKGLETYEMTAPMMRARQANLLESLEPEERRVVFKIIDKLELAAERRDFQP